MGPTLSVILPHYNHARYLPTCLEAMLDQSFRPKEIIVVDDCSTDDSPAVLAAFAKRDPVVRVFRNERNLGTVESSRRGMALASGDYVYFGGSDDQVLPGFFEKSMTLLARHPEAGLCFSDAYFLSELFNPPELTEHRYGLGAAPCHFSPSELVGQLKRRGEFSFPSHTVVLRRAAFLGAGGHRPQLRWHIDWFYQFVIAFRFGVCYVPETLAVFRLNAGSYHVRGSRSAAQKQILKSLLGLLTSREFADVRPAFKVPAVLSRFGLELGVLMLENGRYRQFLSTALLQHMVWFEQNRPPVPPCSYRNVAMRLIWRWLADSAWPALPFRCRQLCEALWAFARWTVNRGAAALRVIWRPVKKGIAPVVPECLRRPYRRVRGKLGFLLVR